jgi:Lrp/AsnC family transcriptional regulator
MNIDDFDRKILAQIQQDNSLTTEELADQIGLSRNACWRRVRRMNEVGVIERQVALVNAEKVNAGLTVFISIQADRHDPDWLQKFSTATNKMPEIQSAYRLTGDLDYLIVALVPNVKAYDALYQRLITQIPLSDVSASFVMEAIKHSSAVPLTYV